MHTNIKEARIAAGLSQKQVALDLGVSAPTVSDWEAGKISPTTKNLIQLAKLLHTSTDYLLGLSDDPSPTDAFSGQQVKNLFGVRIRELREKGGYASQQAFAEYIRVAPDVVDEWESSNQIPDFNTLMKLSNTFHVSIDYLLGDAIQFIKDKAFLTHIAEVFRVDTSSFIRAALELPSKDLTLALLPSLCIPPDTQNRLTRARLSAGLPTADLAIKIGLTRIEYRKYERGEKKLPPKLISDIARVLNVDADWLSYNTKCSVSAGGNGKRKPFVPNSEFKPFTDSVFDPIDMKYDIAPLFFPDNENVQAMIELMERLCGPALLRKFLEADPEHQLLTAKTVQTLVNGLPSPSAEPSPSPAPIVRLAALNGNGAKTQELTPEQRAKAKTAYDEIEQK